MGHPLGGCHEEHAVEGSAFWLIVSAVLIGATVTPADLPLAVGSLVTAVIYLIVAYFSRTQRRWAFIAAIILALVIAVAEVAFSFSLGATNIFEALAAAFLLVPQLLVIFFSLRAHRELAAG